MGVLALAAGLVAVVLLQRLQWVLRWAEAMVWWASNGRDLANGASLAVLVAALWLAGFSGPSALLAGATALLAINVLCGHLFPWRRPRAQAALTLLAGVLLLGPAAFAPAAVHAWANRVAAKLFPAPASGRDRAQVELSRTPVDP